MIDPVVDVGLNSRWTAVEGRVAEAGVEPGRAVVNGGRRGRGVGVPVSELPAPKLVEFCGGAEAAHLELPEEGHGVVDLLIPLNCAPLAGADELPDSFLLVGVPDDELFLLYLHFLDVSQLNDCLG